MTLMRVGTDLSAFLLLLLSDRTTMRFGMCILERKGATAGKRIKVELKTSILGIILKEVEMKAVVVIALRVNMNRLIYMTFLKTSGHMPAVRGRNSTANQPM